MREVHILCWWLWGRYQKNLHRGSAASVCHADAFQLLPIAIVATSTGYLQMGEGAFVLSSEVFGRKVAIAFSAPKLSRRPNTYPLHLQESFAYENQVETAWVRLKK